jgi:hypothetical protein
VDFYVTPTNDILIFSPLHDLTFESFCLKISLGLNAFHAFCFVQTTLDLTSQSSSVTSQTARSGNLFRVINIFLIDYKNFGNIWELSSYKSKSSHNINPHHKNIMGDQSPFP